MKSYFIVVLFVFPWRLMVLSIFSHAIYISSLEVIFIQILTPLKIVLIILSHTTFCVLWTQIPCYDLHIFSPHSMGHLLTLFMILSVAQKYYVLLFHLLGGFFKSSDSRGFNLIFNSFIVFSLIFRSVFHFELSFLSCEVQNFILLHVDMKFFLHHLLKRVFPIKLFWHSFWKSNLQEFWHTAIAILFHKVQVKA